MKLRTRNRIGTIIRIILVATTIAFALVAVLKSEAAITFGLFN
tara:strand:+ start:1195 stop:1323 length:129 start_codon:yes stop_codon:yes gene_type:complete